MEVDTSPESIARALCFIEDAFRSICFGSICADIRSEHVCSPLHEWNSIVELSLRLHKTGFLPCLDEALTDESETMQHFHNLYYRFCKSNGTNPFPWVIGKIISHVEFYCTISRFVEVKYDSFFGFSVFWQPIAPVSEMILEWEFQEQPPHLILPSKFLSNHPQFGPYHPLTVRTWDSFESSKKHCEIMIGIMNMFNSVCPDCETIKIERFHREKEHYPIGYIRGIIRPQSLKNGMEIGFVYQRDWFSKSQFSCKVCGRDPAYLRWMLHPYVVSELIDAFIEANFKCLSAYLDVIELVVFHLEERLGREIISNDRCEFHISRTACTLLVTYMLNCFPVEIGSVIPVMLCGRVLRLIDSIMPLSSSLDNNNLTSPLVDFTSVIPKSSPLHEFNLLFRASASNFQNFPKDVVEDLRNALSKGCNTDLDSLHRNDWMDIVLKKLLLNQIEIDVGKNALRAALTELFRETSGSSTSIDDQELSVNELLFLIFKLLSSSPMRALHHADWQRFCQLHSTMFRLKFQSTFMFRNIGLQGAEAFPQSIWDLSYMFHDWARRYRSKLCSAEILKTFGGNISFLLSKIRHFKSSKLLRLAVEDAFVSVDEVRSHYETYFNGLLSNPSFFEIEGTEDDVCDFMYWCLANPSIAGTCWIVKLSSPSLDIMDALGHNPANPLNLWAMLLYICDITKDRSIVLGGITFDVLDFTRTSIVPIIGRLIVSIEQKLFVYDVADILFVTHVVYLLTDYGNLDISESVSNLTITKKIRALLQKFVQSPVQASFVESLCEIYRTPRIFSILCFLKAFGNLIYVIDCMDLLDPPNKSQQIQVSEEIRFRKFLLKNWIKHNFESHVFKKENRVPSTMFHFWWCAVVAFGTSANPSERTPVDGIRLETIYLLNRYAEKQTAESLLEFKKK